MQKTKESDAPDGEWPRIERAARSHLAAHGKRHVVPASADIHAALTAHNAPDKIAFVLPPLLAKYQPAFKHPSILEIDARLRDIEKIPAWFDDPAQLAIAQTELATLHATFRDIRDATLADHVRTARRSVQASLATLVAVGQLAEEPVHAAPRADVRLPARPPSPLATCGVDALDCQGPCRPA